MSDECVVRVCGLCAAKPARGYAEINGVWYCHEGESPTCYELAQQPDGPSLADLWDKLREQGRLVLPPEWGM